MEFADSIEKLIESEEKMKKTVQRVFGKIAFILALPVIGALILLVNSGLLGRDDDLYCPYGED